MIILQKQESFLVDHIWNMDQAGKEVKREKPKEEKPKEKNQKEEVEEKSNLTLCLNNIVALILTKKWI